MITRFLPTFAPNGMPILEHVYKSKTDHSKRKSIVTICRGHVGMEGYEYIYSSYAPPSRAKEHLEKHKCVFYL